jgi:PhzF family phenazine biosynthesis protein
VDDGVALRFCTVDGDLPACGHGTVAALAVLAERAERAEYQTALHVAGQVFEGWASRRGGHIDAEFATASIALREPTPAEHALILPALGIGAEAPAGTCVATLGRPRMLVPLASRAALAALAPEPERLRAACDRLGLLGCYVHTAPTPEGRAAARMFAPSIGVPEDIANANSTACLAAYLARQGITGIAVDMGDSLGRPSTITAGVRETPTGPLTRVGGMATIAHTRTLAAA